MAATNVFTPAGPTIPLSVTNASHAAVPIAAVNNEIVNFVSCLNVGANAVAVKFTANGVAAVFPVDGTTGDFVLPASMTMPLILPVPVPAAGQVQITAIGASAGPSIIHVTPLRTQN